MYSAIKSKLEHYDNFDAHKGYCYKGWIDKIMKEWFESDGSLDYFEFYARRTLEVYGVDVRVDNREWYEVALDTATTLVTDVGTVFVNACVSVIKNPIPFFVNMLIMPTTMAVNGISSLAKGVGGLVEAVGAAIGGDFEGAGKYLVGGVTDIASGVSSIAMVVATVAVAFNPALAIIAAGVASTGAIIEVMGGVVQNIIGQNTDDYSYALDGASHVLFGLLKYSGAEKFKSSIEGNTTPVETEPTVNESKLSWNQFQHLLGGRGYTKAEMSQMWAQYKLDFKVPELKPLIPKGVSGAENLEGHHLFPKAFEQFFKDRGINIDEFIIYITKAKHRLKETGIHAGEYSKSWNGMWKEWIKEHPKASLPEIMEQLKYMRGKFGI